MRSSDWSSDVCSSDLPYLLPVRLDASRNAHSSGVLGSSSYSTGLPFTVKRVMAAVIAALYRLWNCERFSLPECLWRRRGGPIRRAIPTGRTEEHTSELQSLMRIS